MKTEITITINETDVKMDETEARRVWAELNSLFGNNQYIPYTPPPQYIPCTPSSPNYPYITWTT